jgi:hypothetical protein
MGALLSSIRIRCATLMTAVVFLPLFSARLSWANEALTSKNKAVVSEFYTTVLIGRDVDAAPRFLRPDYIQHNPQVPTLPFGGPLTSYFPPAAVTSWNQLYGCLRRSPLRTDPTPLFEALQAGIESAVLEEHLLFGRLLGGACDRLAGLRSENSVRRIRRSSVPCIRLVSRFAARPSKSRPYRCLAMPVE